MPHYTPLIATIVAGLTTAFVLGALAQRMKASPLVGYLLAGVIVGPFTPGYVADQALAHELAEIGVILLMFGVGLHFSLKELLAVRKIAIPGALGQMATATVLGMGLAYLLGWTPVQGFVFGLALSVASTVVLLRALQERKIVQTERGHIAVGWLIVEDLAMVLALVLLPALAGAINHAEGSSDVVQGWIVPLGVTLAKVTGFVVFMLVVGRRVIPWMLHYVAHTGSRELFRLAVLSIALGVAFGAAVLFDVSFALGAFFAGMILAESELSQRAAEETLPLRDAFAVLFFVSVGMLFNPQVALQNPWPLVATLGIIVVGKSAAALIIMRLYKRNPVTSLTVAASLAQIGEFSFILAGLGVALKLLPKEGQDLILAGAILSILLNPLIFALADRLGARMMGRRPDLAAAKRSPADNLHRHTIVIGFGRVGEQIVTGLKRAASPFVVIEDRDETAARAETAGHLVVQGNAADKSVLAGANVAHARRLLIAIPDAFEAGQIAEQARKINPAIEIIARAHSDEEVVHLASHGADLTVMSEHEIARGMLDRVELDRVEEVRPAPPPVETDTEIFSAPKPKLILDDAERAVLSGLAAAEAGPREAVSKAVLIEHAAVLGFQADRVETAFASLRAKGCLVDLADGRLALTEAGFIEAAATLPRV